MKRFLSAILSALAVVTLLSSCSAEKNYDKNLKIEENSQIITETPDKEIPVSETEEKNETIHTVYFKDSAKSSSATATFFNSANGSSENVEMEKIGEDSDAMTFSCEGDTSKYNMVYVTSGGKQSMEFAFNKCVSGWCRTDDDFFPYTQGDDIDFTPTFDNVTLSGYGYDKNIHIWKPDDYDASSEEKYSTIYILDGQNIADFGINGIEFKTRPGFIEQVRSMSMETGSKAIIVAVENLDMREYELIPDMEVSKQERKEIAENGLDAGEPVDVDADYDAMNGIQFAHFIAKKGRSVCAAELQCL
ncbi:MAG: hypothetical protein II685_07860 [Clostridia bacterium]|nr:hypothetical protein [Clostridia bacterium]